MRLVGSTSRWRIVAWMSPPLAALAAAFVACDSSDTTNPPPDTGSGNAAAAGGGASTSSGGSGGSGAAAGGFTPVANPCEDHANEIICESNVAFTCDATGHASSEQDCELEVCVPGAGCVLCIAGQFSCDGNALRSCNPGPPPAWTPVSTCDPQANQKCNATTGACEVLTPIGNGPASPTGTYYQYGTFAETASAFLGGCDVDSFDNYIYVNRGNWYDDGQFLDVYTIELLDSDGDGKLEPNQHPDNPDAPGPVEERVLTYLTTYDVPSLGMVHHSELYALEDRIYLLNAPSSPGNLFEYTFGTGTTAQVITAPTPALDLAQLGFDETTGTWYASNEWGRRVYSYHAPSNSWVVEFLYPDLAGDHMDGLEVVTDPNTGVSYVYVSDMTSDFLGQYRRDRGGSWVQVNLFQYGEPGEAVEGMGFGTLNHFWITSGSVLYEIGGGDLSKFTEPEVPPQ